MKVLLVVEDDADDLFLLRKACEGCGVPHSFNVARDGLEAVAYLSGDGRFADRTKFPLPHLIFLDIKMPKMDGHQVLRWIRSQAHFSKLPVVMLTTSISPADLKQCYAGGVNSYLRKGGDEKSATEEMTIALKYWLGHHVDLGTEAVCVGGGGKNHKFLVFRYFRTFCLFKTSFPDSFFLKSPSFLPFRSDFLAFHHDFLPGSRDLTARSGDFRAGSHHFAARSGQVVALSQDFRAGGDDFLLSRMKSKRRRPEYAGVVGLQDERE